MLREDQEPRQAANRVFVAEQRGRMARALKTTRARRGFPLRELSRRSGVRVETISRLERGVNRPQVMTIQKLARALEVDVGELLDADQKPAGDSEFVADLSDSSFFTALREHPRAVIDEDEEELQYAAGRYTSALQKGRDRATREMERVGYAARLAALAEAGGGDLGSIQRAILQALETAETAFFEE